LIDNPNIDISPYRWTARTRDNDRFFGHYDIGMIPVAFPIEMWHSPVGKQNGIRKNRIFTKPKKDVQQGTLSLMVLKTLDVLGTLRGYGIARRIEPAVIF
jgi:hypothetical protein